MGQYYRASILKPNYKTTKDNIVSASISPYDFDNGAKLMEHSYINNEYVCAFMHMIQMLDKTNRGLICVWAGDYAGNIPGRKAHENETIFDDAYGADINVTNSELYDHLKENPCVSYKYAINRTKKEFVEIPEAQTGKSIVHPLPILLAFGNGLGLGDYHTKIGGKTKHNAQFVGTWAFDKISVSNEIPNSNYKKIDWKIEEQI